MFQDMLGHSMCWLVQNTNGIQPTRFSQLFHFFLVKLSQKTSFFAKSEILRLFVNTLTADDIYSCYKSQKFGKAIQMQLSKNPKIFLEFFNAFLESTSNFQLFPKKDEAHSKTISDINDSGRSFYLIVLKAMFQDSLGHSMCWLVLKTQEI